VTPVGSQILHRISIVGIGLFHILNFVIKRDQEMLIASWLPHPHRANGFSSECVPHVKCKFRKFWNNAGTEMLMLGENWNGHYEMV